MCEYDKTKWFDNKLYNSDKILQLEQKMINISQDQLIVLISHDGDTSVIEGLFTNMNNAKKYAMRKSVNTTIRDSTNNINKHNEFNFCNECKHNFESFNFDFLIADHLNKNYPIYVSKDKMNHVYGKPTDYLTNNKDIWIDKMQDYNGQYALYEYVYIINPVIPELEHNDLIYESV